MKTIKELEAEIELNRGMDSFNNGSLKSLKDVIELIDELFPCEQLRKLKKRIEGT